MNHMKVDSPELLTPFETFLFQNLDALASHKGDFRAFISFDVKDGIPQQWSLSVHMKDNIRHDEVESEPYGDEEIDETETEVTETAEEIPTSED